MKRAFSFLLLGLTLLLWVNRVGAEEKQPVWNLKEIVVTATKTPHSLKDVPIETVVITKKDIERSSAQTISDLLRYVPGIFVRSEDVPGITSWRASMRGLTFNNGYGLILEDGQRVKSEGMGEYGFGLNQLPPQMIEKIEIVKGPSSVLYGSDALVGVVNIITKPAPDKTIYGFETDYGSHFTNMEYLYWGTKVNSLGMLFQAGREESEMGAYGYRSNRDESYKRSTLISKFAYTLTKNLNFQLKFSVQDENRKRTQNYTRISNDTKYRIAPQIAYKFSNNSKLIISGYWYDWDFRTKEYNGSSGYTPRNGDMYYKDIEFRYIFPFKRNLLTIGSEYLEEDLDYNLSNKTLNLSSLYMQDEFEISLGVPTKFIFGGRFDNHSKYGTEFCPKFSVMFKINDNTKIRASIGKGFKSPTIRQAYYDEPFQHGTYWYKSNPNLKAETSWGYSVSLEKILGSRFWGTISLFRNDVKNMIIKEETNETINGLPVVTYKNAQKSYTQGIEFGAYFVIINNLFWINTSYTYLDTENKDTGKELTYIPHHNLAGHLILDYKKIDLTFDLGVQYVSKMYKNSDNTSEINSYSLVDIKLIKKIRNASFSIEGNNIFNSDYGEPNREWWGSTWLARFKIDF